MFMVLCLCRNSLSSLLGNTRIEEKLNFKWYLGSSDPAQAILPLAKSENIIPLARTYPGENIH